MQRDLDADLVAALLEQEAWVRRLARCLLGGDADVDDVVQQTYLRALTYPPPAGTRMRAWIGQVARNVIRRRWQDSKRLPRPIEQDELASAAASPSKSLEDIELQRRIAGIVLGLDEPYRSAIVLRYYDNQTPSQIAATLGCPVETVRTRVKRGLARIRRVMEHDSSRRREAAPWQVRVVAMLEREPRTQPSASGDHATVAGTRLSRRLRWPVGATAAGLFVIGLGFVAVELIESAAPGSGPSQSTLLHQATSPENSALLSGLGNGHREDFFVATPSAEPSLLVQADGKYRMTGTIVLGETGAPLGDAEVHVAVPLWQAEADDVHYRTATTTTDASGRFDVCCDQIVDTVPMDLWKGMSFVSVTAAGLAPGLLRLSGSPSPTEAWRVGRTFDAGIIPMFVGARLEGRAVVTASGTPVSDGAVYLCESSDSARDMVYYRQIATTGADGSWTAAERVPPRFDSTKNRALAVLSQACGVATQDICVPIAQDVLTCDVEFPAPGQMDITVTDESGHPVAGAMVVARPAGFFWASSSSTPDDQDEHAPEFPSIRSQLIDHFLRGRTDADGHVLLPLLPMHRLAPVPGREELAWANAFDVCGGIRGQCHGNLPPQTVHAGERLAATLVMHPQTTSAVTVTGYVTDVAGQPIAGAIVMAGINTGQPAEAITNETGFYSAELPHSSGPIIVCRADMPPFAPREVELHVDPANTPVRATNVSLESVGAVGMSGKIVTMNFPRWSLFATRLATADFVLARCEPIRGRIVDEKGEPVAGVPLTMEAADGPAPLYAMAPERVESGIDSLPPSGADGRFEAANATAGMWILNAFPPVARGLDSASVTVRGGSDNVVITLRHATRAACPVMVTAVTSNGRRVMPVGVALTSLPNGVRGLGPSRREREAFAFESVDPGTWRAWVSVVGGDCGYKDFEIPGDGRPQSVEVIVGHSGAIRIQLEPPDAAVVHLQRGDVGPPVDWLIGEMRDLIQQDEVQRRPDEHGNVEFTGLAPGPYSVRVVRGDQAACLVGLVSHGQTVTLRPSLVPAGRLLLKPKDLPTGATLDVILRGADGWLGRQYLPEQPPMLLLPPGTVEWSSIVNLSEGRWDRFPRASGTIEVVAGETRELVLTSP